MISLQASAISLQLNNGGGVLYPSNLTSSVLKVVNPVPVNDSPATHQRTHPL
eukprot:bmy_10763T0